MSVMIDMNCGNCTYRDRATDTCNNRENMLTAHNVIYVKHYTPACEKWKAEGAFQFVVSSNLGISYQKLYTTDDENDPKIESLFKEYPYPKYRSRFLTRDGKLLSKTQEWLDEVMDKMDEVMDKKSYEPLEADRLTFQVNRLREKFCKQ